MSLYIEEVNQQLNGVKPSSIITPELEYELPERA